MTDLSREFCDAVTSVTGGDLADLIAEGVSEGALQPSPLFGLASIEPHGPVYEPADDGELAVIVPCGWFDGLCWQVVDLVAFKLADPTRWWRRLGIADVLGGAHSFTIEPKTLHPTPLDWLIAGGKGLVILDWSRDPVDLLLGAGSITADESLKSKLYSAATRSAAESVRILFNE